MSFYTDPKYVSFYTDPKYCTPVSSVANKGINYEPLKLIKNW